MSVFYTIEYICRCGFSVHITDLTSDPYHQFLRGIFLSKENAQNYINEIEKSHRYDNDCDGEYRYNSCEFQIRYICLDSQNYEEDPEIDIDPDNYIEHIILIHQSID